MRIRGYHNTEEKNINDILENGFTWKVNPKHWLGQGIYFFDDLDIAKCNLDMLEHEQEIKTIFADIEVSSSEFLDLDNKSQ